MKIQRSTGETSGFTFIELIIVITVVGLLVAIAVPSYIRIRDNSRLNVIYSNLRTIEHAKSQWALENHKTDGSPVADIAMLNDYFRSGTIHDALRETYVPNAVGTPAEADLPPGVALGPYGPGGSIPAP
jgi:prepilin-type N-terminal cleavage/methylation domain-containing protein